jgi:hypothetical protein
MSESLSTSRNRKRTLILLAVCLFCAGAAVVIGVDDNPPGLLLAFLAAVTFILAFAHPWRAARKFLYLLLAAIIGVVLFIALNILTDTIAQNPGAPVVLLDLLESPIYEAKVTIIALLLPAAFIVGVIGSLVMLIRGRRQPG